MSKVPKSTDIFKFKCQCCLKTDRVYIDMNSNKFHCKDQLLMLGYRDLTGEIWSLPPLKDFAGGAFICTQCSAQLEMAIAFREQCLQSRRLWTDKARDDGSSQPPISTKNVPRPEKTNLGDRGPENMKARKAYKCALCPGIYKRKVLIEDHLREHLKNRNDPAKQVIENFFGKYKGAFGDSDVIKCPECGKRFRSVVDFYRHVPKHIDFKPFKCSFPSCSSQFKYETDFNDHTNLHVNGFSIKCPDCPKTFNARRSLRYHLKFHHRPETVRYACDVCEKKFIYKALLFEHSFIHKDHKQYHCPGCDFNTSAKTKFKRHLKEHGIEYDEKIHGYVESESHKLPTKVEIKAKRRCSIPKKKNIETTETTYDHEEAEEFNDEEDIEDNMSLKMEIEIEDEEF